MEALLSVLGLLGPLSIVIALLVLALLSQRLGAVTRQAPLYRLFFVSVVLIGVALIWRVFDLVAPVFIANLRNPVFYDLLLIAGLIISVVIAWRYWSWLLSERGTGTRL